MEFQAAARCRCLHHGGRVHCAKEGLLLHALLIELGVSLDSATIIFSKNQATIANAHDNQFHIRSKHIDIRHHFIRESGAIKVDYCVEMFHQDARQAYSSPTTLLYAR
ncbi:hypothetical protein Mapa_007780 [Marchantia paleacea]|nr:hypothetical protein Mapa_007780 [Marchantia paleacea]